MSESEIAAPAEAGPDARVFEGQAEQEQPRALVAVVAAARYLWGLAPLSLAGIVYTIFHAIFQHRTPAPLDGWIGVFVSFASIVRALQAVARHQGDPRRSPVRLRADAEGLSCDGVLVAWRGWSTREPGSRSASTASSSRETWTLKTKAGATFVIRPPARFGFGTRDLAGVADRIEQIRALPPSGAHLREGEWRR